MISAFLFSMIALPALIGGILFLVGSNRIRKFIVILSSVIISICSSALIFFKIPNLYDSSLSYIGVANEVFLGLSILMALYLLVVTVKDRKYLATIMMLIQALPIIYFEIFMKGNLKIESSLHVDNLSVIMGVIIGVIGSLIAVYALGYMDEYHHHHSEVKDRRRGFFFVMFFFLSAMFTIVFSNSLLWVYIAWEVTTIASFYLIGYAKDDVSKKNSYTALYMNLFGGLFFAGAIFYLYFYTGTIELDAVIASSKALVLIPAVMIAFAGMTKAAQLPFSSWLLGAMVAPTPVSALLHSSTMVKAGVYIILRLSPLFALTIAGEMIAVIGMFTFLMTSFLAISQSNAKRVLAYSTVGNLGLIVACGGIGTSEAVWAGILLIIFHAIAKGLLFISVGTIEHKLGSRDIEYMDGLLRKMPRLGVMVIIGIAGMFLAPFGMLISKWAVLRAFVDTNIVLATVLIYGSSATLFFWAKWMGKVVSFTKEKKGGEESVSSAEWVPLYLLAIFTVMICGLFPVVSSYGIEPYLLSTFGKFTRMDHGNVIIMLMMLALVLFLPFMLFFGNRRWMRARKVEPYLAGANLDEEESYLGSIGTVYGIESKNYYLENWFGESRLFTKSLIFASVMMVILFGVACIWRG